MIKSSGDRPRKKQRVDNADPEDEEDHLSFQIPPESRHGTICSKKKEEETLIDSSEITPRQIKDYLKHVDYSASPSSTNVGEELRGSSAREVIQDLLDDMTNKNYPFPVQTVDHLIRDTQSSMPDRLRERIQNDLVGPVQTMMQRMWFKDGNLQTLVDSYKELRIIAQREEETHPESMWMTAFLKHLNYFLGSAISFVEKDVERINQTAHTHLVKIWEVMLRTMEYIDTENLVDYTVMTNGTARNMPLKLRGKQRDGIPTIMINTKADILCERVEYEVGDPSVPFRLMDRDTVFRSLIADIKTSNLRMGLEAKDVPEEIARRPTTESHSKPAKSENVEDPSPHEACTQSRSHKHRIPKSSVEYDQGSDDEDDHPAVTHRKDSEQSPGSTGSNAAKTTLMDPILTELTTKHFIELLSMMKSDDEQGTVAQVHGIGLYIVMHRVYVTGLFVAGSRRTSKNFHHKLSCMINNNLHTKKMHYRMVCCKYFNVFKSEHFAALFEFLQYIIFHQHHETNRF